MLIPPDPRLPTGEYVRATASLLFRSVRQEQRDGSHPYLPGLEHRALYSMLESKRANYAPNVDGQHLAERIGL